MKLLKSMTTAAVVGGALAVLGQLLTVFFRTMLGWGPLQVGALTLVALGLLGAGLFALGAYQKLEAWGGFGAMLPFSGLAAAVAGTFVAAKAQGGSTGAAVWAALGAPALIIGLGTLVSVGVGIAAYFVG